MRTPILTETVVEFLQGKGVRFANVDDCASAMLRIASEKSLNGKRYLSTFSNHKLIACPFTTGKAFAVVPRDKSPSGYIDLGHDDYPPDDFLSGLQEVVLKTAQSIVDLA